MICCGAASPSLRCARWSGDLRPLFALVSSCSYIPDFLIPLPRRPIGELEAELAEVRATPSSRAQVDITIKAATDPAARSKKTLQIALFR
jgi:hypothetical protein